MDPTELAWIKEIRSMRSIRDVEASLEKAPLSPNIAATALRKLTQLRSDSISVELFTTLLETIGAAVLPSERQADITIYGLADTITSLSYLVTHGGRAKEKLAPYARKVWTRINEQSETLPSGQWFNCWFAAHLFDLTDEGDAYQQLCERMTKGDALAKIRPGNVVVALSKMASKHSLLEEELLLIKALARRTRKQDLREASSIDTLISLVRHGVYMYEKLGDPWREEVRKMSYTLIKEAATRSTSESDVKQVSILFSLLSRIERDSNDDLVQTLYSISGYVIGASPSRLSLNDIALLLSSLERWRDHKDNKLALLLGNCLQTVFQSSQKLSPSILNQIFRCVVLKYRDDEQVMDIFRSHARAVLTNEEFVSRCSLSELANFLWFMTRARVNCSECLVAVVEELLKTGRTLAISPKTAVLILSSYTSLVFYDEDTEDGREYVDEIFRTLGEPLLTAKLTATDSSSALYAYAKAGYMNDMGIFDHLVDVFSKEVDNASVRQVSQGLWSCGKMVTWEDKDPTSERPLPPYLPAVSTLAHRLVEHVEETTTKDVAQSIWALARLRVDDDDIVLPVVERAYDLTSEFTTHEIVNIIWALGKMKGIASRNFALIFKLIKELENETKHKPDPREAASVLFSLGILDLREEKIFKQLSAIISDQIKDVSAETLAHTLWAHDAVYLSSQQLLNQYATERLGLDIVDKQTKLKSKKP